MAAPTSKNAGAVFQEFESFAAKHGDDIGSNSSSDVGDIIDKLQDVTECLKDSDNRAKLTTGCFQAVCTTIQSILREANQTGVTSIELHQLQISTEGFRALRNACAGCRDNQAMVVSHPEVLDELSGCCSECVSCVNNQDMEESRQQQVLALMKCAVQYLGNACVNNEQTSAVVWKRFFSKFRFLLQSPDGSLSNYTCMVLHSCLALSDHVSQLASSSEGISIIQLILKCLSEQDMEWGLYTVEKLLRYPGFLGAVYSQLDHPTRHNLLDIILDKMTSWKMSASDAGRDEENIVLAVDNVNFITTEFLENAHTILGLSHHGDIEDMDSLLVAKLLEVLCYATAAPEIYPETQCNQQLIQSAINLLQCIHMIGQKGGNPFSNVSKVTELGKVSTEHPTYGLKRDIIRLLGNMAYKNRGNQDKMRELGGIQLIMDHTNIDGRNPFITQWSVFAIRNLLDANAENQALIAAMRLEGLSDNVQQLREFGVNAQLENDRVVIRGASTSGQNPDTPFSRDSNQS